MGHLICVGCSTSVFITLLLMQIFPSLTVSRLSSRMTESHHSISGMSSLAPSDLAISASLVADDMPVFLAICDISFCSFSSCAFIRNRSASCWNLPGSWKRSARLVRIAGFMPMRLSTKRNSALSSIT